MNADQIKLWTGMYAFGYGENIRKYLENLGCGAVLTAFMDADKPDLEIWYEEADEVWTFKWVNKIHVHTLKFKCGEWVDGDKTFDQRRCKTLVTIDPEIGDESALEGKSGFVIEQHVTGGGAGGGGDSSTSVVRTVITKLWYSGLVQIAMECGGEIARRVYRPIFDLDFIFDLESNAWDSVQVLEQVLEEEEADGFEPVSPDSGEIFELPELEELDSP